VNGIGHGLNERGTIVSGFLLNPRTVIPVIWAVVRFFVSSSSSDRILAATRKIDRLWTIEQTTDRITR